MNEEQVRRPVSEGAGGWKQNGRHGRRRRTAGPARTALALLLLLLCTLLLAPGALAETPVSAQIQVVQVTGNHTVEIGIDLTCADFRGVGAVLQYNSDKLKPIQWGTARTPAVLHTAEGYRHSTALYTKGPDNLMGKPALAWKSGAAGTTAASGGGAGTETASEPAIAWNSVYLGADTLQETTLSGTRVVTLRFDYVTEGGTAEERAAAEQALTDDVLGQYLRFAPASEAEETPVGVPFSLILQKGQGEPVYYEAAERAGGASSGEAADGTGDGQSAGSGQTQSISVPIVLSQGTSVDAGGSVTTGGGPVVTFFDWDGAVIDAMALPERVGERPEAVQGFQERTDVAAKLTGKKGYAFDQWLIVTQSGTSGEELATQNGTFTSNNAALDVNDLTVAADVADFGSEALPVSPSGSLLVQAAYRAVEDAVNGGTGTGTSLVNSATYYTLTEPSFYQYGAATESTGQYAVRSTVRRNSALRAKAPTVLAQVFVGEGDAMESVTVKVELTNTDETDFEVVVPKSTRAVTFRVLDTFGFTAWTMGTSRSDLIRETGTDLVQEGAFALLTDAAYRAAKGQTWDVYVTVQNLRDAGYSRVTTENLEQVKELLLTASTSGVLTRQEADNVLGSYR